MTTTSAKAPYAQWFKVWSLRHCGPQPSEAELAFVHGLGLKPGKKHTLANAMYARAGGATNLQVIAAVGAQQLNVMRGLTRPGGPCERVTMPDNAAGHTVYKLVASKRNAATKAHKARGKAAKAATVEAPAVEAPAVDTATGDAGVADAS